MCYIDSFRLSPSVGLKFESKTSWPLIWALGDVDSWVGSRGKAHLMSHRRVPISSTMTRMVYSSTFFWLFSKLIFVSVHPPTLSSDPDTTTIISQGAFGSSSGKVGENNKKHFIYKCHIWLTALSGIAWVRNAWAIVLNITGYCLEKSFWNILWFNTLLIQDIFRVKECALEWREAM